MSLGGSFASLVEVAEYSSKEKRRTGAGSILIAGREGGAGRRREVS